MNRTLLRIRVVLAVGATFVGCGGSSGSAGSAASDAGSSADGGGVTTGDSSTPTADGGGIESGHPDAGGTHDASTEAGAAMHPGNPNGSCSAGLPANGAPADTSHPTTVVGTGTGASCTFSELEAAVTTGGIITFDCGSAPATIQVTSTLDVPVDKNTVIDGGGLITLDGGNSVQILSFNSPGWQTNVYGLTLQRLTLINAKKTPTDMIPTAPPPCSQGWDDGQGGAVYMRDGFLRVIDSIFTHNQAALLGPDTGGGAIYVQGSKGGVLIVGSTFTNNTGANGGAVGVLWAELDVYDSLVTSNVGAGNGANNDDPTMCSAMNNGQNEIGSGGNGGALYSDGNFASIILCGDDIENNAAGANAFGGGLFFTSDNMMGTLTIADTTMEGNTGGHWTNVSTGSVTNVGTAVGVNAKSITVTDSMLQGYP
jgi:hypothetical protein